MSVKIIQDRLESYRCHSVQEEEMAVREITQEIVLCALSRAEFFKRAAFQGGTCLRIFYGLERFSEDLDFILKKADKHFTLDPYLKRLVLDLEGYGYQMEVVDRSKAGNAVKKIFLKDNSLGKILKLNYLTPGPSLKKIKIKIEVDTNPPGGSGCENKYGDFPLPYAATLQDMPSLFAGKSHALLCREYAKARDWYDFLWYTARSAALNLHFLSSALNQIGPWQGKRLKVDMVWYVTEMEKKIRAADWMEMKREIVKFLRPSQQEAVKIWSAELFLDRLNKLKAMM